MFECVFIVIAIRRNTQTPQAVFVHIAQCRYTTLRKTDVVGSLCVPHVNIADTYNITISEVAVGGLCLKGDTKKASIYQKKNPFHIFYL